MDRKTLNLTTVVALLAILATTACQEKINYLRARNELNKGVRAFVSANYSGAVESFDRAIALDPELLDARSYRASCFMLQVIPAGESDENLRIAEQALEGFGDVLSHDPNNELAMASIASVYFNIAELEQAKDAYRKLLDQYPDKKDAYYTIGVINWTQTYQPRLEVRASLGMKPEDPGPIKDQTAREELAEENLPLVEEGIEALNKALDIDPEYDNAMAYLNLLYRERADLVETKEEYDQLNSTADEWIQKSLAVKKRKAEESIQEAF